MWEQDAAGSNPVTRTKFRRKAAYLCGFSAFFLFDFCSFAICCFVVIQGPKQRQAHEREWLPKQPNP